MEVFSCACLVFIAISKNMNKHNEQNLEELIVAYFQRGFLYEDILKHLKNG